MNSAVLPAPDERLFQRDRAAACVGGIALVSLLAFEVMAVAAAMPAIATALDGVASYAVAFGGTLAASVLGMVVAGASCDRRGPMRATVAGLVVFVAGLLVAGLAPTMGRLVAGRVIQGFGVGMLGVTLYVGLGQVVPASLHPRLFAMMAAAWVVPGLVGPATAALLVDRLGWRSVFLLVAAATPLAAAWLLPPFARLRKPADPTTAAAASAASPARDRHVDVAWAMLAAAGALGLNAAGGAPPRAAMLLLLCGGLVAATLSAQRLLPRGSLAAVPGLPAVIALRGLLASAFASAEAFVPLALTRLEGLSLVEAGLVLSMGAVLWSLGSAVQARLRNPASRRRALRVALVAVGSGIAAVAAQVLFAGPTWLVPIAWSLSGFGIGLGFPMLSVLTLGLSAPDEQGRNASALQLCDALASSAVLAVAGALFNLAGEGSRTAFALVFALAAAVAFGGAVLAGRAHAAPG